jgi:hypothetical protein
MIEVRLLNIPNPHVDGMIIAHVVGPNLVYVTDLISPRGPIGRNPATVAVGDALRKADITDSTIVGGHHGQAGRYRRGAGGQLADADCKKENRGAHRAPRFDLKPEKFFAYGSSSVSQ